ncbi:Os07g0558900 [Oryza sativa Japonica Group]|uniref:Os07g0558900 protein n=1 Tax=Oryza sativa subsp. japonica TaxID=39947 RepID=A0A0P0X7S5_ORYSJ|nr:Os07g0558900 [Oryza sativa Japonica Group]
MDSHLPELLVWRNLWSSQPPVFPICLKKPLATVPSWPMNTNCIYKHAQAYMAVTLGAAIELKEQVAKPCSSAAKRGASVLAVRPSSSAATAAAAAAEESLRMVMYLSCWGPS